MASPQITIAKPVRNVTQGILPVPATATRPGSQKPAPRSGNSSRALAPRLKLVIRRLPPGLTRAEFEEIIGQEWKLGGGKVDWFTYKAGKISQDPSKASRASRAYLHLTSQALLTSISEKVRQVSFQDANNSWTNFAAIAPPSVEFAPYNKVPSAKTRHDARQGTIDQDPEFIAFLESLTSPIALKPSASEATIEGQPVKPEKITVTPLVQYLKDKKANKIREAMPAAKVSKHSVAEERESRTERLEKKPSSSSKGGKGQTPEQRKGGKETKGDRAVKEAVKVLTREASAKPITNKTSPASGQSTKATSSTQQVGTPSHAPDRKRERGNFSAAAKILQRDLGLAPGPRRGTVKKATIDSKEDPDDSSKTPRVRLPGQPVIDTPKTGGGSTLATTNSSTRNTPAASTRPDPTAAKLTQNSRTPTGPATARSAASTAANSSSRTPKQAQITGTQAFLKHANPSQGITEPLLKTAMEVFGPVTRTEIDKKKGFAYVDFSETEALQKAVKASPVKVAEGQVVVLVLQDKKKGNIPTAPAAAKAGSSPSPAADRGRGRGAGGARGGRGRGRGSGGSRGGAASGAASGAATTEGGAAASSGRGAPTDSTASAA